MSQSKLLLAVAGCLSIALAGCGGGASSSPATDTPGPSGGAATPAEALEAAESAVAAAQSAETAATIAAARAALDGAVQTAQRSVQTAETTLSEAQAYQAAQIRTLEGLQVRGSNAVTLAAAAELEAAENASEAAQNAVAAAQAERTAAAIEAAIEALEAAVKAAQDALEAARRALSEAQAYREAQNRELDKLQPPNEPSNEPARLPPQSVTHVVSTDLFLNLADGEPPTQENFGRMNLVCDMQSFEGAECRTRIPDGNGNYIENDYSIFEDGLAQEMIAAINRTNGFEPFGSGSINDVELSVKRVPVSGEDIASTRNIANNVNIRRSFVRRVYGVGTYSAFGAQATWLGLDGISNYTGGSAFAFGNIVHPRAYDDGVARNAGWKGAMAGFDGTTGTALEGEVTMIYNFAGNSLDISIQRIENPIPVRGGIPFSGDYIRWNDIQVLPNGEFYSNDRERRGGIIYPDYFRPHPKDVVQGAFYGSGQNVAEAAGVFEAYEDASCSDSRQQCRYIYGGWLAKQPELLSPTVVYGNNPGPVDF